MVATSLSHARSPWQVPDWRWHRAIEIVDGQGPPATLARDGASAATEIKRLVRYRREQRRIATLELPQAHMATDKLINDFQHLGWAIHLYEAPELKSARWEIEARILARQTDEEIASTNRCSEMTIRMFEHYFFNVRDNLDRTEHILHSVFGDRLYQGLTDQDYGVLWKLLGYFGGPDVVGSMTRRLINPSRVKGMDGVPAFFHAVVFGAAKQKAVVAAMTTQANTHTGLALIDSFVKYLEVEKAINVESSESDKILGNISSMMGILSKSFCVGSNLGALKKSPIGEELEHCAAELRGDQMLRRANGYPVENLEELKTLKFPEP